MTEDNNDVTKAMILNEADSNKTDVIKIKKMNNY